MCIYVIYIYIYITSINIFLLNYTYGCVSSDAHFSSICHISLCIYLSINLSINLFILCYIYVICYICIDILSVYMYVYDIYKCVCKIIHNKHATKVN